VRPKCATSTCPSRHPAFFARINELSQARLAVSGTVHGFGALYHGARGSDEVNYRSTYVAATGRIFVSADPASSAFSTTFRNDAQRASGTCQQVR
jgi:hypothetical protein